MSEIDLIQASAREAREAARRMRKAGRTQKDAALRLIGEKLQAKEAYLRGENERDVLKAKESGLGPAMLDRLTLDGKTIRSMVEGLKEVEALPDPVGEITRMWKRPNGLLVGQMRIPLGVIGFIYESRPNVTVDAASLCLKSGNAVILRGGSEAVHSNQALGDLVKEALAEAGLPGNAVQVFPVAGREALKTLLGLSDHVDLIIPRGGEGLIRFVTEHSRIPVLRHYKGVCHVYVDEFADLPMAAEICFNAKVQRPAVCNAMETLLVHERIAPDFLPAMAARYKAAGVELRGCPRTLALVPDAKEAQPSDWPAEYSDLILAVKIVSDMDEALDHIERHGSNHTETIVTSDYGKAQRFLSEVDSSVVLVNASTRFNDGNQLGLGAEIGISTSKLHAFGPMGLEELTTKKFIVYGSGQVRT